MDTLRGHIKRIPERLAPKIDGIKTNFDEWKVPWTADRAGKLYNLDAEVSTRATQASVDGLMSNVGETADVGGTQNAGTVNAKLNAILQKQKVIRGLAIFEGVTDVASITIQLPQTISPEYANVSVSHLQLVVAQRNSYAVVTSVTNTTIGVDLRVGGTSASKVYIEWQVVGGVD